MTLEDYIAKYGKEKGTRRWKNNEYMKRWYQEHPEYLKRYYQAHQEERLEYKKRQKKEFLDFAYSMGAKDSEGLVIQY